MTPNDLFTHPLVTQLVAHYRSEVVIGNKGFAMRGSKRLTLRTLMGREK